MFNSRNLGALIVDEKPHVKSWDEPQYSIQNLAIEESYGFGVLNEGHSIAVPRVRARIHGMFDAAGARSSCAARIPLFWTLFKAHGRQHQPRLISLPEVSCSDHERSTPKVLDSLVESERRGPGHHRSPLGAVVLRAKSRYFDPRRDFQVPRLTRCFLALAETPSSDLLPEDRCLASRCPVPTRLFIRSALVLKVGSRRTS